ncbi:hypothetical protein HRbin01_01749 [archaeon HR01]|nr:hypothetical protein HRbin01_01749 [archaeon HR01]
MVRKSFLHNSEIVEIDIFCDEPLVVGEVTSYVKDFRTAELELSKLLERRGVVERIYGRKPLLTLLVVGNAAEEVSHRLVMEAEKAGVRLVLGREIGEIA